MAQCQQTVWFDSWQERWDNFLLQGQLSVLTLILVLFSIYKIPVTSAKSAGGRLQLNTLAPYICDSE